MKSNLFLFAKQFSFADLDPSVRSQARTNIVTTKRRRVTWDFLPEVQWTLVKSPHPIAHCKPNIPCIHLCAQSADQAWRYGRRGLWWSSSALAQWSLAECSAKTGDVGASPACEAPCKSYHSDSPGTMHTERLKLNTIQLISRQMKPAGKNKWHSLKYFFPMWEIKPHKDRQQKICYRWKKSRRHNEKSAVFLQWPAMPLPDLVAQRSSWSCWPTGWFHHSSGRAEKHNADIRIAKYRLNKRTYLLRSKLAKIVSQGLVIMVLRTNTIQRRICIWLQIFCKLGVLGALCTQHW